MHLSELKRKSREELAAAGDELGVDDTAELRHQELILAILRAHGARRGDVHAEGVLEVLADGFGFLRAADASYLPGPDDVYVSPSQIRRFDLRTGDSVSGLIRAPKDSERYFALLKIETINERAPAARADGFDQRTAIPATRILRYAAPGDTDTAMVQRLCPLAAGHRCFVLAPPHAGKSELLVGIASGLAAHHPEVAITTLLVAERPEDVSELRRRMPGEIVSSTFDEPAMRHTQIAEIALERAKRLVERGQDVVVLVDSLSRLARAYDVTVPPSPRRLAGDLDPAAVHRLARFLGAAHELDGPGSLTLVGTLLTGRSFDDALIAELSGVENSEIHLRGDLAEARIHPALDVARTRCHSDARLLGAEPARALTELRRELRALSPADALAALRARVAA